ncbi:MAG: hypothetical protein R3335_13900, partial [Anaerolineales bacterium]|nr:hypothetical protein [Anaerolineales bacterium]
MSDSQPPEPAAKKESAPAGSINNRINSARTLFTGDFARKGYLSAADQGLISVTNFLAALILARQVDPAEFGVYTVGFAALHLVRAILDGLVVQPMNALGSPMEDGSFRSYISASGVIQILLALGFAVVTIAAGWLLTAWGNDTAGPALGAMWFMFLTWPLQDFIRRIFYARNRIMSAVINTFIASAVRLGVLAVFVFQGNLSGVSGLDAIGWGSLAGFLVGIPQARDQWTYRFDSLKGVWKRNWVAGRWILGGSVANWVALEVYPILAAGMISFAAAGIYRALQLPVAPVHVILRAADTFITPRAAAINARDGFRGVNRVLRLSYVLVGVPVLVLLALAVLFVEPVLSFLFGETYITYAAGMG